MSAYSVRSPLYWCHFRPQPISLSPLYRCEVGGLGGINQLIKVTWLISQSYDSNLCHQLEPKVQASFLKMKGF